MAGSGIGAAIADGAKDTPLKLELLGAAWSMVKCSPAVLVRLATMSVIP